MIDILKYILDVIGGLVLAYWIVAIFLGGLIYSDMMGESLKYPRKLQVKYWEFKKMKRYSRHRMKFLDYGALFDIGGKFDIYLYFGVVGCGRYAIFYMAHDMIEELKKTLEYREHRRDANEAAYYKVICDTVWIDKGRKKNVSDLDSF